VVVEDIDKRTGRQLPPVTHSMSNDLMEATHTAIRLRAEQVFSARARIRVTDDDYNDVHREV
jgi:hypothetical protein